MVYICTSFINYCWYYGDAPTKHNTHINFTIIKHHNWFKYYNDTYVQLQYIFFLLILYFINDSHKKKYTYYNIEYAMLQIKNILWQNVNAMINNFSSTQVPTLNKGERNCIYTTVQLHALVGNIWNKPFRHVTMHVYKCIKIYVKSISLYPFQTLVCIQIMSTIHCEIFKLCKLS